MVPFASVLLQAQTVPLTPFVDGGSTKMHGARPIVVPVVGHAATLRIGSKTYRLLVVDANGARTVYLDRNGNGRPDGSERIKVDVQQETANDRKPVSISSGQLDLPGGARFGLEYFVSATADKGFAAVRDKLSFFPLSGFTGQARFGAKTMRIGIRGADLAHGALFVDRDGDGVLGTIPAEMFALAAPFNLGGTTYHVTSLNTSGKPSITFAISPKRIAEVPMPPDLSVGKIVPTIPGKTLGGKAVSFPRTWPGKVVLLDVWATWCGPCRGEFPFMRAAYAKHRGQGFEIVSMSIDDPGTQAKVAAFTKANGMAWTQVFQGQSWQSPVCKRLYIQSIPFELLVDGSTGRILATEGDLRGPNLEPTVAAALARRR